MTLSKPKPTTATRLTLAALSVILLTLLTGVASAGHYTDSADFIFYVDGFNNSNLDTPAYLTQTLTDATKCVGGGGSPFDTAAETTEYRLYETDSVSGDKNCAEIEIRINYTNIAWVMSADTYIEELTHGRYGVYIDDAARNGPIAAYELTVGAGSYTTDHVNVTIWSTGLNSTATVNIMHDNGTAYNTSINLSGLSIPAYISITGSENSGALGAVIDLRIRQVAYFANTPYVLHLETADGSLANWSTYVNNLTGTYSNTNEIAIIGTNTTYKTWYYTGANLSFYHGPARTDTSTLSDEIMFDTPDDDCSKAVQVVEADDSRLIIEKYDYTYGYVTVQSHYIDADKTINIPVDEHRLYRFTLQKSGYTAQQREYTASCDDVQIAVLTLTETSTAGSLSGGTNCSIVRTSNATQNCQYNATSSIGISWIQTQKMMLLSNGTWVNTSTNTSTSTGVTATYSLNSTQNATYFVFTSSNGDELRVTHTYAAVTKVEAYTNTDESSQPRLFLAVFLIGSILLGLAIESRAAGKGIYAFGISLVIGATKAPILLVLLLPLVIVRFGVPIWKKMNKRTDS